MSLHSLRRRIGALTAATLGALLVLTATTPAAAAAAEVVRISGSDRYETSAKISREAFASGADVVFVASGEDFPDALSGAAAAGAADAPVLLVMRSSIPETVRAELARLSPNKIVILGGDGVVGEETEAQLRSYAPVERLAGADRYQTSAVIAATFASTDTVYVAPGDSFPDALAGAAVAGRLGSPLLLVGRSTIPVAVQAQISRFTPRRIVILGGPGVVDEHVARTLRASTDSVSRLSGTDRFETSVAVSQHAFPAGASTVYLANGMDYPDALAGTPAAASRNAPVLLVTPGHLPSSVRAELNRLRPGRIIVLGGAGAISEAVVHEAALAASAKVSYETGAYDQKVLAGINVERTRNGLPALRSWPSMRQGSQDNSARMAVGTFGHETLARIQADIYAAGCRNGWRENIHYSTNVTDPAVPVRAWMVSKKGHREAILHPGMAYAGVGSVLHEGRVYNTLRLAGSCS